MDDLNVTRDHERSTWYRRLASRTVVSMLAGGALVAALVPALADPLPETPELQRILILARDEVPFDSLGAGAIAGHLGGVVCITSPTTLTAEAQECIEAFAPDVIVIAGGFAAISQTTEDLAEAACGGCVIDRRAGEGRDETAYLLSLVPSDYGYERPLLVGTGQVVGDANLGGTLNVDDLTTQSTETVENLNADTVDGVGGDAIAAAPLRVRQSLLTLRDNDSQPDCITTFAHHPKVTVATPDQSGPCGMLLDLTGPFDSQAIAPPAEGSGTVEFGRLTEVTVCHADADPGPISSLTVTDLFTGEDEAHDVVGDAIAPACLSQAFDLETTGTVRLLITWTPEGADDAISLLSIDAVWEPYTTG